MKKLVCLICLTILPSAATAHPREMILAGGAMKLCSSLSVSACKSGDKGFSNARKTARYKVTPESESLALSPLFWESRKQAPSSLEMMQMIRASARKYKDKIVSADDLADTFSEVCTVNGKIGECSNTGAVRVWDKLLDDERAYVLSAFELPESDGDQRRREVTNINDSKNPHGLAILNAFVNSAAKRSPGKRPVVLFVTAAGADPYDAVDFYISAFKEAGADPVWWPIDSALQASLSDPARCNALGKFRITQLALSNREAVYPDLTAIQKIACENAVALAQFPLHAQGIFFGGGDQWRLRKVFFDEHDQANAWLQNLKTAFNAGSIVVGGTSAGTAVQSSRAMLTGGISDAAITRGTINLAPLPSGCERSQRCPDKLKEEDVTYWQAGGLALVEGFVMDTHFSERARPLRLLKLLSETHAGVGLGVDETSALHLVWKENEIEVEALGASGAWWFEHAQLNNGSIASTVHYIAPERRFVWKNSSLSSAESAALTPACRKVAEKALDKPSDTDALKDKILRNVAQRLAQDNTQMITLQASNHVVTVSKTPQTKRWCGSDGQIGISGLLLEISADEKESPSQR
jgi:cyanophycinase-like exopeptidase